LNDPAATCAATTVITTTAFLGQSKTFAISAPGFGLFLYVFAAIRRRKNWLRLGYIAVLVVALFSCSNGTQDGEQGANNTHNTGGALLLNYTLGNLTPGSTYYWKVIVSDNNNGASVSEIRKFTTQN